MTSPILQHVASIRRQRRQRLQRLVSCYCCWSRWCAYGDNDTSETRTSTGHSKKTIEDRDEMLSALHLKGGFELRNATNELKDDRQVVMAAVTERGLALIHASDNLKGNKEVVLAAVANDGLALRLATEQLQGDLQVVLAACQQTGQALQYASNELQGDRKVVLAAVSQAGQALQFASHPLRADKDVVLAAVSNKPEVLKYALGGLNQDEDCWKAAKLYIDEHPQDSIGAEKEKNKSRLPKKLGHTQIVLSTKFSLNDQCNANATTFTVVLNKTTYFTSQNRKKNFIVYSPNAFSKSTCDPNWTSLEWPCRGTLTTCRKQDPSQKKDIAPTNDSCWRYSFRCHLDHAKQTNGFMIQVVDYDSNKKRHVLGDGQKIEIIMAFEVGIKVFRVCQPVNGVGLASDFTSEHMKEVVLQIKEWYAEGSKKVNKPSNKAVQTNNSKKMAGFEIQFYYCYSPASGWTAFSRVFEAADMEVPCLCP